MSIRISREKAEEIVELKSRGLQNKEVSKLAFVSEATVSRVLRQQETYLTSNEYVSWEDDKKIGKRCNDCGVIFRYPNGKRVVCRSCANRRRILGLPQMQLSAYGEI